MAAFVTRTRLQERLRRWDHGNRASRLHQLGEFIQQHANASGPQLDAEMDNGASLFLARITSWLRLSYALGHSVALQLQAVSVFVSSSSGQRFLAEFVEVGGVATVIEILRLTSIPDQDKAQALNLLTSITSGGRHYKEIVCELSGVEVLEALMLQSKSEEQQEQVCIHISTANPATGSHSSSDSMRVERPCYFRRASSSLRLAAATLPSLYWSIVHCCAYFDQTRPRSNSWHAQGCDACSALFRHLRHSRRALRASSLFLTPFTRLERSSSFELPALWSHVRSYMWTMAAGSKCLSWTNSTVKRRSPC